MVFWEITFFVFGLWSVVPNFICSAEDYTFKKCMVSFLGSIAIIQEMIGQVLKLHPDITAFHIGADEVSEFVVY